MLIIYNIYRKLGTLVFTYCHLTLMSSSSRFQIKYNILVHHLSFSDLLIIFIFILMYLYLFCFRRGTDPVMAISFGITDGSKECGSYKVGGDNRTIQNG